MSNIECKEQIETYLKSHPTNTLKGYLLKEAPTVYEYIIESTQFLPKSAKFIERVYNVCMQYESLYHCPCGLSTTKFATFKRGYTKYCSEDCRRRYRVESIKKTCKEKYGVDNPASLTSSKEKVKKTCMEKYGATYSLGSAEIKEKAIQTNISKYGTEHFNQSQEGKDKFKQTCLDKYGASAPMQNQEIREKQAKSAFKKKEYVLPSGKSVNYQGYEDRYISILLEQYHESDIEFNENIPEFWYTDDQGNLHRYYPDIFIPKDKTVIEVKSAYTASVDKRKNQLKEESVKKLGFNFKLIIFNEPKRNNDYKEYQSFSEVSVKNRIIQ